jgi:predicted permease
VEFASAIPDPPISGFQMWTPTIYLDGQAPDNARQMGAHPVGADYFQTMGIRLLTGRGITLEDTTGSAPIAVVSQTAAQRLWPDEEARGQRLKLSRDESAPWITVVGVVNDVRQYDVSTSVQPQLYVPYSQHAWFGWNQVLARTRADASTLVEPIRRAIREVDSNIAFDSVNTMAAVMASSLSTPRFHALLFSAFAGMALLLAAAGIYSTMLFMVGRRTREMAIRVALGARPARVIGLVIRQGMLFTGIGIVIGLVCTLALTRIIASLMFDVGGADPTSIASATSVLVGAALLACYVPARRAARIDPNRILRSD